MKNKELRKSIFSKRIFAKGLIPPWSIFIACCIMIIPVLFIACEYSNKPRMIYDPTVVADTTGIPTITGFVPATEAGAGVREITIVGTNLGIKNGTDTNWVVVGGDTNPVFKDIQNSYITIYRPALSSDHYDKTIQVNITDRKILSKSSSMTYMIATPGAIVGDYSAAATSALNAVDFDKQENLYVEAGARNLYKTDFAGVTQSVLINQAILVSSDYASVTAMEFGPGGYRNLFIAVGKNYIARQIVLDTANTTNRPLKLTVPAAVSQLDFDQNGNMFTGGIGTLFVTDSTVGSSAAPTFTPISGYAGGSITKIRVFNGNLYIADSTTVWESPLPKASNSFSFNGTLLVDLSTHPELSGCTISSFDLDENGSIFLCLKHHPKYSLFIRESDGSITPFYSDPNILPNTVEKLMWGNSHYLYLISGSLKTSPTVYATGRIYRLILDRNGAPYQGRTFIH